ncbi:MAG TPA: hypothetical protein VIK78_01155 [Ruminiclostridium sp.]
MGQTSWINYAEDNNITNAESIVEKSVVAIPELTQYKTKVEVFQKILPGELGENLNKVKFQ